MQRLYALRAASVEQTEGAAGTGQCETALENGQTDVVRSKTHLEENLVFPPTCRQTQITKQRN
jgi:cobalt-zinc-cadmium efflux system membrane fusion protein